MELFINTVKNETTGTNEATHLLELKSGDSQIATANTRIQGNQLTILFMEVNEEHRGKGMSSNLLDEIIEYCKSNEIAEVAIDGFTPMGQERLSKSIYQKFKETPEIDFYAIQTC